MGGSPLTLVDPNYLLPSTNWTYGDISVTVRVSPSSRVCPNTTKYDISGSFVYEYIPYDGSNPVPLMLIDSGYIQGIKPAERDRLDSVAWLSASSKLLRERKRLGYNHLTAYIALLECGLRDDPGNCGHITFMAATNVSGLVRWHDGTYSPRMRLRRGQYDSESAADVVRANVAWFHMFSMALALRDMLEKEDSRVASSEWYKDILTEKIRHFFYENRKHMVDWEESADSCISWMFPFE